MRIRPTAWTAGKRSRFARIGLAVGDRPLLGGGNISAGPNYVTGRGAGPSGGGTGGGSFSHTHIHASLTALGADDHTQYLLADGSRELAANWDAGAFDITTTGDITANNLNIADWDNAYGWGDHALAGYLTAVAFADLTDYPADAAGVLTNDGAGVLTWEAGGGGYTDEMARDAIGTALTEGTGIDITVDDGANTITIASSITQFTAELAQDAVGNALGTGLAYDDGSGAISLSHLGLQSLTDPGANVLMGWDDTDNLLKFITLGTNLTYDHASHTLNAAGGGGAHIEATAPPGVNDDVDLYTEGTIWVEQDSDTVWFCADNADGAAVWHGIDQDLRQADAPTFDHLHLNGDSNQIVLNADGGVAAMTLTGASSGSAKTITFPNFTGTVYVSGGTDVPVADGGTGLSVFAVGDIVHATGTTTLAGLADVAVGAYLKSGGVGVVPAWATLNQAAVAGLTTADSPQFTAVNIGHATDTTLTRVSAGVAAIESKNIYLAGGTDVALADGGTGASLADPNADRIMFWDDSAGATAYLACGDSIAITTTTLDAIQDIRTTAGPSFDHIHLTTQQVSGDVLHFHWEMPGNILTDETETLPIIVPCACTFIVAKARVGTAPTGAAINIDIHKNGSTSIFDVILSIAATATSGEQTDFDNPTNSVAAEDDYLSMRVEQVGSTIAGGNLVVDLWAMKTAVIS